MHVQLPEQVALASIDVAWTKQRIFCRLCKNCSSPTGRCDVIKPHYEAPPSLLRKGCYRSRRLPKSLRP